MTCFRKHIDFRKTRGKYLNLVYEKDMRKINKKETKIDTDLEKLEAERTSIKTEQDDLKKVIDDNVNLTFKLFS